MAEIIVIQLTYDSYNMKDKINSKDEPIWCKKIFHNGLYYYAFRNLKQASKEEHDFMSSKKISIERYEKIKHKFGTMYMSQIKISLVKMRWIYTSKDEK
ncbi:hypothetical protein MBOVJF4428_00303 [Mycoplasmopsis agalactiae]|uniref:Uncharacterized protein n=1 Tax=Mycoplasmopsis agalactiae (strain NCTC 10123 / CIP 59.7 / PG2) TaxID=347257 RepID=A5IYB7_MYCAP|nr:Hypothetical protein MAG3280 [Mycoplasmopsis agalactiae PG2]SBO45284.1 hypothetical protein MBOVJF4428_00303 [Mycoplasmopsis agalactiae]